MQSKKIFTLLLTLCLLSSTLFAATSNIPIYFEKTLIDSSETPAYISSSRTYIPVRTVGKVLNLNVDWQSPNVILSGKHQTTNKTLTVSINTKTQTVILNGKRLTQCIELKNSRSYITLRVLAESFGYNVTWRNRTVYITKPIQQENSLPNNTSQTNIENQVLSLVNIERAQRGLTTLKMDENLRSAARLKSSDMRQNNYFSHTSPTYGSPFDMLKNLGISYQAAAENIAQGYSTPELVVNGWMNSSGHRANILNNSYTHIGIGYDANGHYWTQLFIKR